MNILITGGSGFIGQHFIRNYPQYKYTILTRNPHQNSLSHLDCTCITDLESLENLNSIDAVINLAGEPIIDKWWTDKQKHSIRHSRWDTTEQLVKLIEASNNPPSVLISGSAIGYYGNSFGEEMTEDSSCPSSDFSNELCQKWEAIAELANKNTSGKTRVALLRTSVVLGAEQGALKKMLLPFKLGMGAKLGSGKQIMSWIHIDDAVNAIHTILLNADCHGPYNLSSPNPVSNDDFTNSLAAALNSKAFLTMPTPLLRLAMGESADLLLNSQNVIPKKLLEMGFNFKHPKLQSALNDLLK